MGGSEAKLPFVPQLLALASVAILAITACAPQAAAPTAAPAQPAPTAAPPVPAPTSAPAKAAAPTAKPAATAAPAVKPTEKPAAKPAEFDEKAVADFYKGKTVRIVVGFGPGGTTDINARLLQKALPRYIPGNPVVAVENKPGGGGLLVFNTVYNSEAKDGTVIAASSQNTVLQQAIGAPGVQFDAAKLNWLASTQDSPGLCAARTDSGISRIQDIMDGGKELTVSSYGKGTASYIPPATLNLALGTRFKIVTGYEASAAQILAVKNKEVQGFCTTFDTILVQSPELFEGANPVARVLIITGAEVPNHPFAKGVPVAEQLARTDEARAMLKAINAPDQIYYPFAVAPEVPRDRVLALRRAFDKAYADSEYLAAAEKANLRAAPRTGEEVTRIVQAMLSTPPATLAKLKQVLE